MKRWTSKFGFPYKIISDSGGGLRDDFINQLEELGIVHKPSSAYHSEIAFAINSHISQEGSGSNNDRFLGRSVRTRIPNSVNPQLNIEELIKKDSKP